MYDDTEYIEYIKDNQFLTECQKKEFLYSKTQLNSFYVNNKSNKQIITYLEEATKSKDFDKQSRIYVLFGHFLNLDFVNLLLDGIKIKKYTDSQVYSYVLKHLKKQHKKADIMHNCLPYTYIFENLSLKLYSKFLKKEDKIKYLDVACGNGKKTKIFANKLELDKENVWGTDIEEWGPYKKNKENMPINFKLLKNNKLDFKDNEFDIVSIFFSLHHIPEIHAILGEFSRVLKPNGVLVIIDHNILNDYDHLIVDIEHSLYSHIKEKRPDSSYSYYFNFMELDFICGKHNFEYRMANTLYMNIAFEIRYDNPYYAIYVNKK